MPRSTEERITTSKETITKSVSCNFCGKEAMVKWKEEQDFYDEDLNATIETLCSMDETGVFEETLCSMDENGVFEEIIICPDCFRLLKDKKL